MRPFDDDQDMRVDEDERLIAGRPVPGEPEIAAFVAALRCTVEAPAPRPSPALAALLRDGLAPALAPARVAAPTPVPVRAGTVRLGVPRPRNPLRYLAGLGLAAKILLGAGVAAASVTGAATIDAVPDVVQVPASVVVSGLVGLFTGGTATPAEPVPAPVPGNGPSGTPAGGGTPATSPSAAPVVPGPVEPSSPAGPSSDLGGLVPVDPGAGNVLPPGVRDLLKSPVLPADVVVPLPPVVPLVLGEDLPGLVP